MLFLHTRCISRFDTEYHNLCDDGQVFFSGNTCGFLFGLGEVHVGGQEHFYMETQSVLAIPRGEDKEMDVFVSTQHPAFIQVI